MTVLSTLNNLKSIPCINAFTGRANNSYLWRYVMEDHKDEFGATTIKCFYLREEISEDYVSIYHSNKDYYEGMVRDVFKEMKVAWLFLFSENRLDVIKCDLVLFLKKKNRLCGAVFLRF
ncbi:hypothetical protein ACU4KJ_28085 [Klebsiella pneumoniae]|uniref:hypothetical protein n=1 Tax=Klebsiella pneumoniae TaxID=573 RepID=UPI00406AB42C